MQSGDWYLYNWAIWVKQGSDLSLGFPTTSAHDKRREKKHRKAYLGTQLSEKEALLIDSLVSKIKAVDPEANEVVCCYYLLDMSLNAIAKKMDVSSSRAGAILNVGRYMVEGMLLAREL